MEEVFKKNLINLFWKILPFIITGGLVGYLLSYGFKDITYFCIFIPFIVIVFLPVSATIICIIRKAIISRKMLEIGLDANASNPPLDELDRKAGKWFSIALFNLFAGFFIIALITVHFERIERKKSPFKIVKVNQPKSLSEGSNVNQILNTLDTIIKPLWKLPLAAIALAAILLLILIILKKVSVGKVNPTAKSVAISIGGLFGVPIIITIILGGIMQKIVLHEVRFFLNNVSPNAKVVIGGKSVNNGVKIIEELSKVAPMAAHRSAPLAGQFRIEITDGNQGLVVDLGRDDAYNQEYWFFIPVMGLLPLTKSAG
jgi:hypothetical protein